ncbi:unnamed protein product, partial [Clonostachys chloroleuca]
MESNITGPVTAHHTYSTEFPLPLPKRPELDLPDEPGRANKIITGNLVCLFIFTMSIRLDAHSANFPYGPVQFWKLLSRYNTIVKSRFEEICEILDRDSEEPIHLVLDTKSDQVTIADLVQEIEENLELVSRIVEEIEKEVLPSLGVDVPPDLSPLVPNISFRECRLWSILNNKEFHYSTNLGQSFRQLASAKIELFTCCYSCKTTQAWNE